MILKTIIAIAVFMSLAGVSAPKAEAGTIIICVYDPDAGRPICENTHS